MNCRVVPFLVILLAGIAVTASSGTSVNAQRTAGQRVAGEPFVAKLWRPPQKGPSAGVLLIGGSGGGIAWQDYWGAILARHGFTALALAYFGMEGLPKELDAIPLEYFLGALEYMQRNAAIDRTRIGVVGVSRGGELALLLASYAPAIDAVVAFVPSSVVFQSGSSTQPGQKPRSSWTFRGHPFPFVAREAGDAAEPLANEFRRALAQRDQVASAAIPVERIRGPILLLSGKADTTWPSSHMSEMVVARLRNRKFRFPYEHVA
jgi:dienelactone hydrolase